MRVSPVPGRPRGACSNSMQDVDHQVGLLVGEFGEVEAQRPGGADHG